MAHILTKEIVSRAVVENLATLATSLPKDIYEALCVARKNENSALACQALDLLIENAQLASDQQMPLCQDTGAVWCCLEIGPDVSVSGDVLSGVNDAVAHVYTSCYLRKSLVKDALFDRSNTQDNTPAFTELSLSEKPGARLHLMCKGGGSDNASRVVMLAPGLGKQGIINEVLDCVRQKAANACPPLVLGIGIGGSFDKVASLAKHAIMRPLNEESPDKQIRNFEAELLHEVNALGIGPAAFGGKYTALGVRVQTAACHIAALPLAINMSCSATRRGTYELFD